MFYDPLETLVLQATGYYPKEVSVALWTSLGSGGGFSGSRVWHGTTLEGKSFALKAHPPGADRRILEGRVHPWQDDLTRAGMTFIPQVIRTRSGATLSEAGGRLWEINTWMPGRADFHDDPNNARLQAAMVVLAQIHQIWAKRPEAAMTQGGCPAFDRRLGALTEWEKLTATGWKPKFDNPGDPVQLPALDLWNKLPRLLPVIKETIAQWRKVPLAIHPCLCDVWHDHLLYQHDVLTGLIDFTAAKVDHPAVDLARCLGSLLPQGERWDVALTAYESVRHLPDKELVRVLDRSGTVVAAIHWIRWLYQDKREYDNREEVADRLALLSQRLA
jgi:Ser/Thr protein kinase RdoA (MazF antagonist)